MLDVRDLQPQDLAGLSPEAIAALAARMLEHIREQDAQLQQHQNQLQQRDQQIEHRDHQIKQRDHQIEQRDERIERQTRELEFKEAKLRKVTFELARLKNWKFGAKTEVMSAEQRRLFEETLAEDEASLRAQLEQLQGKSGDGDKDDGKGNESKRKPRRQSLP